MLPKADDKLLDHPFLTESEIKGLLDDIRAASERYEHIPVIDSDFWERAKTEMVRRQVLLQIDLNRRTAEATDSVARWTLRLTVFTGLLVAVTAGQVIMTLIRRHAVAVALVGWYLMTPPAIKIRGQYFQNSDAPMPQWATRNSYDTASECEQARQKLSDYSGTVFGGSHPPKAGSQYEADLWGMSMGTCMATDDPRLKEK